MNIHYKIIRRTNELILSAMVIGVSFVFYLYQLSVDLLTKKKHITVFNCTREQYYQYCKQETQKWLDTIPK